MNELPKVPSSKDVIREASNKLKIVEHQRELEEKFFQKSEEYNEYLKKFEEKLSESLYYNKLKSSNINEKTFSKIFSLLEQFTKLDPKHISNISKILINKNTSSTQTDSTDESILINKNSLLEQSNEKLSKEKNKYKSENEILKKENEELKIENEKLNKQYIQLNHKIEEDNKNRNEINKELSKLKNDNLVFESQIQQLNKLVDDLKLKIKNYEEKIKIDMEKKKFDLKFINFYKNTEKITFNYLLKTKQLNKIFDYLDINDIVNYRLCCKDIYKILNNEKINALNKFYLNIIKQKNDVINKINKYDIKTHYLTKLPQLEQLIKIYSLDGKQPGTALKLSIDNALFFLNKNIKGQLGLPESRPRNKNSNKSLNNFDNNSISQDNTSQNNTNYDSFFGGFKSIFGFGSEQTKPQDNNVNTNNSNQLSKSVMQSKYHSNIHSLNISPYRSAVNSKNTSFIMSDKNKMEFGENDELILNEINSNDYGLKSSYEFDYNNPDDINKYLNKFLKSPFPVDKLTDFINKLCVNFSELLYNSYITIREVHHLEIVSKCLNERFKFFYDLNSKNEKIIKQLYSEKMNNNNIQNKSYINKSQNSIIIKKDLNEKSIEESENINISEINNMEEGNNLDELEKKLDLTQMNLNISNKKAELYEKKYEQINSHFEQYKEMTKEENNNLKYQIDLISKEKKELEKKINDFNIFFSQLLEDSNKNKIMS